MSMLTSIPSLKARKLDTVNAHTSAGRVRGYKIDPNDRAMIITSAHHPFITGFKADSIP